jgi:hypothetical protein
MAGLDGCIIPRQASRLYVNRNVTLTLTSVFSLKSKLCYDRRPVGQSVLVSGTHLGPIARFSLLSDICLWMWGALSEERTGL